MQEADVAVLANRVLWSAFALGAVFGGIAQRTHFCTMGAVADIVTLGDWTRMRMWVLAMAVAVAIAGFGAMAGVGWIDASNSLYAGPRLLWFSHAVAWTLALSSAAAVALAAWVLMRPQGRGAGVLLGGIGVGRRSWRCGGCRAVWASWLKIRSRWRLLSSPPIPGAWKR
jgi:Sulphur transport